MATIKKSFIGEKQFGGFTPYGNLTTLRTILAANAAGAIINSDSRTAIAVGDVVVLEKLPEGFLLEDAQVVVSTGMSAGATGSLGFIYVDGVDSQAVPQDAAYFGAGLDAATPARIRTASSKAPVRLAKEAFLVWTQAGAANAKAARIDVIVHGERLGPN
ncbi:hypothetical protein A4F85_04645 [Delftia sp. GW456-R20]|uniref:hypothetical protein n=1 Tax=Delftia sp. GW456-R20 TaxID=1827145 RepID=UPI0007AEB26E|nr:hypothetical protein [Delftia sp. GW456-R20]KZK32267.1 hypothetical protein A4F85_04645 [Delftia sp. GW456-R20]